jgi:transposase
MARFDAPIQELRGPFDEAVGLLETMPGVARPTADMLVAALGTELCRFPRADHLASWAGVAPGHYESVGKRASGKTRQSHRCLRTTLVQAAHAAARTRGTYLGAPYRRLATRRGKRTRCWPSRLRCSSWPRTCSTARSPIATPAPTGSTDCRRQTPLNGSSNGWHVLAIR